MPSKRFSQSSRNTAFGRILDAAIQDASSILNAVDFIESTQGLNVKLYPIQRVIVKAVYGVPMDYKEHLVPVWDRFHDNLLYTFKETDYLHYVFNEGRCNVDDWRDLPEDGYNETAIFAGRRGGKSAAVSAIGAYALYLLLNIRSPQEFFGLKQGSRIDFTFMAQDDEGANRLFDQLRSDINHAPFFVPYTRVNTNSVLAFVSESDRHKAAITPSIHVQSYPCLDENELIWTSEGLLSIGNTEVGDTILDKRAVQQDVYFKQNNFSEVVAIETTNFRGDPLLLTPQHICFFVTKNNAFSALPYLRTWKHKGKPYDTILGHCKYQLGDIDPGVEISEGSASQVAVGDYFLFPRIPDIERNDSPLDNRASRKGFFRRSRAGRLYYQNPKSREVKEFPTNPIACRLYGLYLAEGHLAEYDGDPSFVAWDFHIKEKDTHAKFVQDTLMSLFNLPSTLDTEPEKGKHNSCRVVCCSTELARGLKTWFGKGCYKKTIPFQALYWSVECQQAIIRGYLDGDGNNNRDIAPTTSKKLAYSLFALGIQARLWPAVSYKPAYKDKHGDPHAKSWYIEFCAQERYYRFYQRVGDREYYWSKVMSNKPLAEKHRVVDIGVEDSQSFLTKLGVTHNCTTNAVRGPSSIFLAFDEFAHFRSAIGSSSDEVYEAAKPSTANFHHVVHENGEDREILDRRILSISSPWKKVGKMYELHKLAMEKGKDSHIFTLRCCTAEMNPTIPSKLLHQEFETNSLTWKAEYGGDFLESSESFVTEAQLKMCVDCQWPTMEGKAPTIFRGNLQQFHPTSVGRMFFWGIDLGMINDATAVAIAHLEPRPNAGIALVYDYIDRMYLGEKFDGPGVLSPLGTQKYVNYKVLDLNDIITWLFALHNFMPCFKGATDQHGGQMLIQLLELHEIHNIELVNLTPAINSQMYYALRGKIEHRLCSFPYIPKFINEVRNLEAEFTGKYQIRVQAPAEKGSHDDMADAVALVAYQVNKWLETDGRMLLDPLGSSLVMQEQMNKPSAPLLYPDAVSLTDLKFLERKRKLQENMGYGLPTIQYPPWSRQGGKRRR